MPEWGSHPVVVRYVPLTFVLARDIPATVATPDADVSDLLDLSTSRVIGLARSWRGVHVETWLFCLTSWLWLPPFVVVVLIVWIQDWVRKLAKEARS